MKTITKKTKLAGAIALALAVSAPMALVPTASFAAEYHHDKDRNDHGRNGHSTYDRDRHDKDPRHGWYNNRYDPMRDARHRPALRHDAHGYAPHPGWRWHDGHWNWQRDHWVWIAGLWLSH